MDTNRKNIFVSIRVHSWLIIVLAVFALRLPFLRQAVQGDDPYYLYGAEHALIDPLHPASARYMFQGDLVDMRGHPHPPLNLWILALPLAVLGDVREAPFHFYYILFSLIAALSTYSLARRFCDRPLAATLACLAVPAFVINGTSFEADLPFLAVWMLAVALFVKAVDEESAWALAGSALAGVLAGLAAYQSVLLTPILAVYLWPRRRSWIWAWATLLAAPAMLAAWQIFEWATRGALPIAMLLGYMRSYHLQAGSNKLRSAAALTVHAAWIVSPLIVVFWRGARWRWIAGAVAAVAAAIYDPNPLFWISFGCGVILLASCIGRDFLRAWIAIFFCASAFLFFAGSARYLLPMAAPVAILAVRTVGPRIFGIGVALQLGLGIALAIVNYQHWEAYRGFAAWLAPRVENRRVWINAEWGLRFYLEANGALPLPKDPPLRDRDVIVSSELAYPLAVNAPVNVIAAAVVRPAIPLRIISLDGRSAYSVASPRGLLPFEISRGPIDRVRTDVVLERKAELTWIDPKDPHATAQIVSGLFPDGWMTQRASVILKRGAGLLVANLYVPDIAPARRVSMSVDGRTVAQETFSSPGVHSISSADTGSSDTVTVTLEVDKTFSTASDLRKLGIVVVGIGFK
jgi:4-amino-4-deoxy-L-arabinose transferase-like glycosyltransferase